MAAASPPPPPTPPSASVLQPSGNIPQLPALAPSIQRVASSSAIDGALKRAPPTVHSWSSCPAAAFKVRCGPNYKANGKKAPSAGALYEVSAVDVYQSQMKLAHVGRVTTLPEEPEPLPTEAGLPTHVIINFMVPNYAPGGLLGSKKTNGPGWNLVLYCRPSEALRALFREGSSTPPPPSVDLLRRYMHPSEGVLLRGTRLKCIFGVVDLEGPAFGMVMKQMVKGYNFKPFLSKTASFCYWEQDYFEIDVDIHTWSSATLSAFHTLVEKIPLMLLRGGVVIEADGDAEMPEQLLACVVLARIDPKRAPPFPAELVSYLADEANQRDPLPRASRVRAGQAGDLIAADPASDICSATPPVSDAEDADDLPPSRSATPTS